ncbi:hypothetical protein [uncultured Microbacterium sp.]|uniref:hypothetical protein n=1 Tax=uncultured Microbacterium sp. TaxID=191216 RepID=UPI002638FF07|nr:hypothetical protein [uncultured Microbacterium sp.]
MISRLVYLNDRAAMRFRRRRLTFITGVHYVEKDNRHVEPVKEAFKRARIKAIQHMTACEGAQLRWAETSITETVIAQVARAVTVAPFTQTAESHSGADWIWWWVDGTSAYGMLVQAKRVTINQSGRWHFGFAYKAHGAAHTQRDVLFSAAAKLGLLPVYALYLGTPDYRRRERCSSLHQTGRCLSCVKRAVSLAPALLATDIGMDDASSTYESSVALEDLWTPAGKPPLIPVVEEKLSPELSHFLTTRQDGTGAVTRAMIDRVLQARFGQFSAATASASPSRAGLHDMLGPIFRELPEDTMHGGVEYFPHLLDPLRHAPPGYVLDIESGTIDTAQLSSEMPESVAGVVVVRTPHHQG